MFRILALIVFCFAISGFAEAARAQQESIKTSNCSVFAFDLSLALPGSPENVYDLATGDISEWWDHSFSENPKALYIEPKPGGAFMEVFDDDGNGVVHATVTAADRGKLLRFVGPLGLAGNALYMSHTYTFEPIGADSTRIKLSVHASGEVAEGWPDVVHGVWRHFLFDQFKPFVESRAHIKEN